MCFARYLNIKYYNGNGIIRDIKIIGQNTEKMFCTNMNSKYENTFAIKTQNTTKAALIYYLTCLNCILALVTTLNVLFSGTSM